MDQATTERTKRPIEAVIFDLGGVIIPSPIQFLIEYEKSNGLPSGTFKKTIVDCSSESAWAKWERREITVEEFGRRFSAECSEMSGQEVDLRGFPNELKSVLESFEPHEDVITSIQRLRAAGFKTALLTNNFCFSDEPMQPIDCNLFDVVVESARVQMRKPESRIFQYTVDQLRVKTENAVLLDDLDVNVEAALRLGIRTIKVTDTLKALRQLEEEIGGYRLL